MEPAMPASMPDTLPGPVRASAAHEIASPYLSVVIVNYRQWRNTARLTRQLLAAGPSVPAEVVIVDNRSPRHPLRARLRRANGVSVRCWGRNRGFGAGVNEGCRLSRGEWFLLLNPDVSVEPGFVERALQFGRRLQLDDPKAGIVGFQVRDRDGSLQPSAGQFPTLAGTLCGVIRKRSARKCQVVPGLDRKCVPWVSGCCLLIRRECFEQLGGFDRDFFLYYEDVDLCRRATQVGWRVYYEPALHVTHHHPLHTRSVPPRLRLLTRHALLTYARKHWPAWQFRALAGIVRVEAGLCQVRERLRGRHGAANIFRRLGRLATAMLHGRHRNARARLLHVIGAYGGEIRRTEGRPKPASPQQ